MRPYDYTYRVNMTIFQSDNAYAIRTFLADS